MDMSVKAPLATPAARQARARILDLARKGPADPEFLRKLSGELRLLVPFTAALWAANDPLTSLAISPARLENVESHEQCNRFWEREFLVQDFNLFRDLARAECPVASLHRATGERLARSVRYRELNRDLGFGDELRGVFRTGGAAWGVVTLWREDGQQPFSAAEEKLIEDLSGPIAAAFRRAALLRAGVSGASAEAPGLLVFDQHGTLESFNDQAEAWLRELPLTVPGELPTAVLSVAALAEAIAAGVESGVARAHLQSQRGRWLVIHGFPLRTPQDAARRTAIVIEPAKSSQIAPIISEAFDLGPREQQITQLIARGLSTAQIATQLYLSPYTVRDYVKSIFGKVGVSSRGELVARLFADHYAEPLGDALGRAAGGEQAGI